MSDQKPKCYVCGKTLGPIVCWADDQEHMCCSQECTAKANREHLAFPKYDPVNHPSHYTNHPSGVECIQITEHMSFNIGNAIKYLWRNGLKDGTPATQDLEKAVWYINREIKRLTNANIKV